MSGFCIPSAIYNAEPVILYMARKNTRCGKCRPEGLAPQSTQNAIRCLATSMEPRRMVSRYGEYPVDSTWDTSIRQVTRSLEGVIGCTGEDLREYIILREHLVEQLTTSDGQLHIHLTTYTRQSSYVFNINLPLRTIPTIIMLFSKIVGFISLAAAATATTGVTITLLNP